MNVRIRSISLAVIIALGLASASIAAPIQLHGSGGTVNVVISAGEGQVLTVNASGVSLTYQWMLGADEATGPGAKTPSYTATQAGVYTCIVKGACGDATSVPAMVTILTSEGSIGAVKQLGDGAPVQLGGKGLYLKWPNFGFIEEAERFAGIRVEGALTASQGERVSLIGTMRKPAGAEPYIDVTVMTPNGPTDVKPLAASNRAVLTSMVDGLDVTIFGVVKPGSITANSYVISDGSDDTGIKVITNGAPKVIDGGFVVVTGAAAFDGSRVIYAL